jgi:hypothetical protein
MLQPAATSLSERRSTDRLEQKQRLRSLLPECSIVAPEPLEGAVVNIAQAKKATRQISDRHRRGAAKRRLIFAVRPVSCCRSRTKGGDRVLEPESPSGATGGLRNTARRLDVARAVDRARRWSRDAGATTKGETWPRSTSKLIRLGVRKGDTLPITWSRITPTSCSKPSRRCTKPSHGRVKHPGRLRK